MTGPPDVVPCGKGDVARAQAAVQAGYPEVGPVIGELLEWLQDGNWPVAHVLGPFLRDLGPVPSIVENLRTILDGEDDIWKYWVLWSVVDGWEATALVAIEPQLGRLAEHPSENESAEGVDEIAGKLLGKLHSPG